MISRLPSEEPSGPEKSGAPGDASPAPYAKIARLPLKIRDELNRRIQNGEPTRNLLEWLNSLEEVKKLAMPVNEMNLSRWRNGPYQTWLQRQDRLLHIKDLSAYAAKLAKENSQSIAEGAIAIASGQILELLEAIENATGSPLPVGEDGQEGMSNAEALIEISKALQKLKLAEQNDVKLSLEKKNVAIAEERLALDREKYQQDAAAIALRVLKDDRAAAIEAGSASNEDKIQMMGQHLFGTLWKPKPVAAPR